MKMLNSKGSKYKISSERYNILHRWQYCELNLSLCSTVAGNTEWHTQFTNLIISIHVWEVVLNSVGHYDSLGSQRSRGEEHLSPEFSTDLQRDCVCTNLLPNTQRQANNCGTCWAFGVGENFSFINSPSVACKINK